jgi:hypothetical protein
MKRMATFETGELLTFEAHRYNTSAICLPSAHEASIASYRETGNFLPPQ